jgi:hypothetical protein
MWSLRRNTPRSLAAVLSGLAVAVLLAACVTGPRVRTRGYVFNEASPDLRVNLQGIVQEKTDVYSTPRTDFHYFYSYRARRYYGVPVWYDQTQVSHYREGTLTIDLVDAARNRLVWTGSAIGRVTQKTPQERAMEVDRAIASVFMQFPYRAGTSQVTPAN